VGGAAATSSLRQIPRLAPKQSVALVHSSWLGPFGVLNGRADRGSASTRVRVAY
jgi:hypothetical protein